MGGFINKCKCCGNNIGLEAYCNVCGMTPSSVTDSSADLDEYAKKYIEKVFANGKIDILCYISSCKNKKIFDESEEYFTVCNLESYWVGRFIYLNVNTKPIPKKSNFDVDVRISYKGNVYTKKIVIKPNEEFFCNKIGVEFLPCCCARLVIEGNSGVIYSEDFNLIGK